MLLRALLLPTTALLIPSVSSIFLDDAYKVDYHHALLGFPQEQSTFFHPPFAGSKASLVYTLSEKSVLGAINPKDGSLVWRQKLNGNATEAALRAGEGQDVVVSGSGAEVSAWSSSDGRLSWTNNFGDEAVKDVEILELQDPKAVAGVKDVIVLSSGNQPVVRRLAGGSGEAIWTFIDDSGDIPLQVSASATHIFYVSLYSSMMGSVNTRVTTLDPVTGQRLEVASLSTASEVTGPNDILYVGVNSAVPIVAWSDEKRTVLKMGILGTSSLSVNTIENDREDKVEKITFHAPHRINAMSHFLVHFQGSKTNWAEVYHINLQTSKITKAYTLPRISGSSAFSVSTSDANVYFTRITDEEMVIVSSASHGILARWPITDSAESSKFGDAHPVSAVSEVIPRSGSAYAVRAAVLLSNGDWSLIRNGEKDWTRHEALAGVTKAVFARQSGMDGLTQELEIESHANIASAYIHRIKRHIKDLQHLPSWLQNLPKRILDNFLPGGSSESAEGIQSDKFGFHQLVVTLSENGLLSALDAGNAGRVVWSTAIAKGDPEDTFEVLRSNADGTVTVSSTLAHEVHTFNASTGKAISASDTAPESPEVLTNVVYDVIDGVLKAGLATAGQTMSSVWQFAPANGERIVSVTARPTTDPVASIGKVLGDRNVLYKFLNPNLVLIITVVDASRTAAVYLLDSTSGEILYSETHAQVDTSRKITGAVSENWFSYSLALDSTSLSDSSSNGYQLVIAELYESAIANDRGPLGATENYSSINPTLESQKPYVISQSYHISEEISQMRVTQTKQGITSKQLLVTLPRSNSVVGIPRQVLDPRRPVGRDPNATEVTEGLMRYMPVLEFDPKWYLNHRREVIGVEEIITSPANVESTSLVFAYGLDIFGTRVSPSFTFDILGKDFNKLQMSATVVALFFGVLVVAPLVRRKQINSRWQMT
ncbi:DUF1620-domain-containing protein [Aulographum hederae CBS 113979]|uniref:ER membrane protein complex subunit 1 n=1 Tax=Aulographum hederae CBS 113979 TaxID=1176131 RepID=A0A6G1H7G7_9PEZI|nr:DUF1620-domain-containing protein [Aulographum hederae CBS 113979]